MDLVSKYRDVLSKKDLKGLVNTKPFLTIRVNTLKTTREELMKRLSDKNFLVEPHELHEQSIIIKQSPFSPGSTTEYLAGHYILQDAASMWSVTALNPQPGELVLDMAAAPGAKTTHISELMRNEGVVVAFDLDKRRLRSVQWNAERMGCENIMGLNLPAQRVTELGLEFDKVLLDAPCSAEGTLHKNPEVLERETSHNKLVKEQHSLIEAAISVLKPGGKLVYSTCAINPKENEGVLKHAISQGLKQEQISIGVKGIGGLGARFYPHKHGTQGFYIGVLVK